MLSNSALLASLVALSAQFARGALFESVDSIPDRSYDYIIVGGGTAGSVIASRLTERARNTVLLIEAGPNNEGEEALVVPGLYFQIPRTYSWNYTTEPTVGLNNRAQAFERGHVLGGSSCLNGMIYTRGAGDDYDSWARTTGDPGWRWNNLFPLFRKHERWLPPVGGRDTAGQYDPRFHGFDGRTQVSLVESAPDDFDLRALQTTQDLRREFPFNRDPNSGTPIGLTWTQSTIGNGERSSASRAYLDAPVRARPNLDIVVNAYATRVLRTGGGRHIDVRTVELATAINGTGRRTLTAAKEVILSAGAIGTPQILLNSGIGDRQELSALGIQSLHHLPDVGRNMADHATTVALWNTTSGIPLPVPDPTTALEQWRTSRSGPMTEFARRQIVWSRIPSKSSVLRDHGPDPSSGRNAPHIELALFTNGAVAGASVVLLTPKSRGTVKLRSSNPFDAPRIDINYFSHPFDMGAMREGSRIAKRFFSGPAWADYLAGAITADPDGDTAFYEENTRNFVVSTLHPTGTASMSARGARNGVLDPDLRVKGLRGLRVADASSIPLIPTGHTQAGVYGLAERAAVLIGGL